MKVLKYDPKLDDGSKIAKLEDVFIAIHDFFIKKYYCFYSKDDTPQIKGEMSEDYTKFYIWVFEFRNYFNYKNVYKFRFCFDVINFRYLEYTGTTNNDILLNF